MRAVIILFGAGLLAMPAIAQDVSVPSVTVANPGGYANPLKLDTDRYDREQRAKAGARSSSPKRKVAQSCSAETMPAAEQRRIAAGYMKRAKTKGKAHADIWVREEGVRYRMRLVAQGICPPPTAQERDALREWREQRGRP